MSMVIIMIILPGNRLPVVVSLDEQPLRPQTGGSVETAERLRNTNKLRVPVT